MITWINWGGCPVVAAPGILTWKSRFVPLPKPGASRNVGGRDYFYGLIDIELESAQKRMRKRNQLRLQRLEEEQTARIERQEAEMDAVRQRSIWAMLAAEI